MFKGSGSVVATARSVLRGGFDVEALTGTKTLTKQSGNLQGLDPDGASRDVVLPGSPEPGYWFLIANRADGAEDLVIKDADGLTIATANQNDVALMYADDDGAWQAVHSHFSLVPGTPPVTYGKQ